MATIHACDKATGASSYAPKNWPSNLTYLTSSRYSRLVPSSTLEVLRVPISSLLTAPPGSPAVMKGSSINNLVAVQPIINPSHPANGQNGLFATQNLPPNAFILCYLGRVHTNSVEDTDPNSDYDLSLDRELGIGVDARFEGTEARFINDYRGVPYNLSQSSGGAKSGNKRDGKDTMRGPNAEFRDIWVDIGRGIVEKRIGVFVLTAGKSGKRSMGIKKGEEVLVSYGKGFWAGRSGLAEEGP